MSIYLTILNNRLDFFKVAMEQLNSKNTLPGQPTDPRDLYLSNSPVRNSLIPESQQRGSAGPVNLEPKLSALNDDHRDIDIDPLDFDSFADADYSDPDDSPRRSPKTNRYTSSKDDGMDISRAMDMVNSGVNSRVEFPKKRNISKKRTSSKMPNKSRGYR
jgi:hypothetical protein